MPEALDHRSFAEGALTRLLLRVPASLLAQIDAHRARLQADYPWMTVNRSDVARDLLMRALQACAGDPEPGPLAQQWRPGSATRRLVAPPCDRLWRALPCGQDEAPSWTTSSGNARAFRTARRPWTAGGGPRLATRAHLPARGRLRRGFGGRAPNGKQWPGYLAEAEWQPSGGGVSAAGLP